MIEYRFMPEEVAITPPRKNGLFRAIADHWWAVVPDKGLAFYYHRSYKGLGSPQCNSNKAIVETITASIPNVEIKFFHVVYVPINVADYCDCD